LKINIAYVNQLIDFKEYTNPVRVYLDDPIDLELSPNKVNFAILHIAPAKTEFLDDIFKYWEKVSYKYAHV
jgi:hypothetical protein